MDPSLITAIDSEIERGLGPDFRPTLANLTTAFARAEFEGITPQMFRFARERGFDIPFELRTWWRDHVARKALYQRLQRRVDEVIDAPYVVLKGLPLTHMLFGDAMQRSVTDLDILVEPKSVYHTIEQMRFAGFRQVKHHSVRPWAYNQVALRHEAHGAVLELHWRIAMPHLPSPPARQLIADRDWLDGVPVLSPSDNVLLLVHHFFQHGGFAKGLFDLIAAHLLWPDAFVSARHAAREIGIQTIFDACSVLVARRTNLIATDVSDAAIELADTLEHEARFLTKEASQTDAEAFAEKVALCGFLDQTPARIRSAIRPILFGPHRIGNVLGSRFGREWW